MGTKAPIRILALSCVVLLFLGTTPTADAETEGVKRWSTWEDDLDYLFEEIEKEASLEQILKDKGIDWRKVRKEATKRFKAGAKIAKSRRKPDQRADKMAFYGVLRYVVGQLRDSHAYVKVEEEIAKAWRDARPKRFQAGIELQPGTHGTIIVANTFAARRAESPLHSKGVRHEATILESVNGKPAAEYFEDLAAKMLEDGWLSTPGLAYIEALNALAMGEDESLKLVFQTLKSPDADRTRYVERPESKRAKAFKRMTWKDKKVTLRASECENARNPRNFRFMALKLPELTKTADKGVWYGTLPSGFGYILYTSVSATSRRALDNACAGLEACPGLVLDLRDNGGGGESGVGAFDKKKGSWDKPVAVLIGPKAFSAGETEIWALHLMRDGRQCDARFFGTTSAGASGSKIRFKLPSGFAEGRFVYRHWRGGRSTIEGRGIEPDEVVLQDVVELSLGIDSCIRRAEAWLGEP